MIRPQDALPFYDPADFEPRRSIGYLAKRFSKISEAGLEASFVSEEVTYAQWRALACICSTRVSSAAELAQFLSHDPGAMTRLVDVLEYRGLIVRNRCSTDRRIVTLNATDLGHAIAARCKTKVAKFWNDWLTGWEGDDIEQLIVLLSRLAKAADGTVAGQQAPNDTLSCGSAWKKDPGSGVIGVEKGPLIPLV